MIYGITGQKQSGKNTVAKIWQALDFYHNKNVDKNNEWDTDLKFVNDFLTDTCLQKSIISNSTWQQKSFAHKLKQIVSTLIDCSMEDLEQEGFKNSLAPKFNGQYKYTNRELLQYVGTELFRNQLSNTLWIDALFVDYEKPVTKAIRETGGYTNAKNSVDFPKWLITDVRFLNEAEAIKKRDGKIIRVNRLKIGDKVRVKGLVEQDGTYMDCIIKRLENKCVVKCKRCIIHVPYDEVILWEKDVHQSEVEFNKIEEDYSIYNCQDFEFLIKQIKQIMIKEGVIGI